MDPHYRTFQGFQLLIEKEWISFGHKFSDRCGHLENKSQQLPVFLLFIDCIWQITQQFPTAFEFNSKLLLFIMHHLHSGLYGTFLCNSPAEAKREQAKTLTVSVWTEIKNRVGNDEFRNGNYSPIAFNLSRVLVPSHSIKRLSLWTEYYLRWIIDTHITQIPFRTSTNHGFDQNISNNSDINRSRTLSQKIRQERYAALNIDGDELDENGKPAMIKRQHHHSDEFLESGRSSDDKPYLKLVQQNKELQTTIENLKRDKLAIQKQNNQLAEKYNKLKKKLKAKNINIADSDTESEIDTSSTKSPSLSKNSSNPSKEKGTEAFPGIPLYTEGFGPGMRRQTAPHVNPKAKKEGT